MACPPGFTLEEGCEQSLGQTFCFSQCVAAPTITEAAPPPPQLPGSGATSIGPSGPQSCGISDAPLSEDARRRLEGAGVSVSCRTESAQNPYACPVNLCSLNGGAYEHGAYALNFSIEPALNDLGVIGVPGAALQLVDEGLSFPPESPTQSGISRTTVPTSSQPIIESTGSTIPSLVVTKTGGGLVLHDLGIPSGDLVVVSSPDPQARIPRLMPSADEWSRIQNLAFSANPGRTMFNVHEWCYYLAQIMQTPCPDPGTFGFMPPLDQEQVSFERFKSKFTAQVSTGGGGAVTSVTSAVSDLLKGDKAKIVLFILLAYFAWRALK